MALEQAAEEYFSKINSMAKRMYEDMKETKQAYEDLWQTISDKEQKEILSESIITPEALLKYKETEIENHVNEYAVKLIIDENCSYTDEHSGPFSFKTKSQRDLSLFEKESQARKGLKIKPKGGVRVAQNGNLNSLLQKPVERFVDESDFHASEVSPGNTLPKTGLDFLDNW